MSTEIHVLKNWYNGHRLVRYVNVSLPSYTLRVRYNTGVTPIIDNATVTPVQGMTDVYDVTTVDGDWSYLFYSDSDLLEVIEANSTGVTNMAYMFSECYNLINVYLFDTSSVTNMQGTFGICRNVQSGALALYTQASTQTTPPANHTDTFYKCGENTVTGAADLDQIPDDWGGNLSLFKTVTIGNQTWMAENLAIDDGGSGIYTANVTTNGVDFGTQYYYTSGAALRIANSVDNWHLPNSADWTTLVSYVGGKSSAGNALKSTAGWYNDGNGSDTYGFSAIPVGYYSDTRVNYSAQTASFAMSGFIYNYGANRNVITLSYDYNSISYGNNSYDLPRTVRLVHD